jgi:hypothetical protein
MKNENSAKIGIRHALRKKSYFSKKKDLGLTQFFKKKFSKNWHTPRPSRKSHIFVKNHEIFFENLYEQIKIHQVFSKNFMKFSKNLKKKFSKNWHTARHRN